MCAQNDDLVGEMFDHLFHDCSKPAPLSFGKAGVYLQHVMNDSILQNKKEAFKKNTSSDTPDKVPPLFEVMAFIHAIAQVLVDCFMEELSVKRNTKSGNPEGLAVQIITGCSVNLNRQAATGLFDQNVSLYLIYDRSNCRFRALNCRKHVIQEYLRQRDCRETRKSRSLVPKIYSLLLLRELMMKTVRGVRLLTFTLILFRKL